MRQAGHHVPALLLRSKKWASFTLNFFRCSIPHFDARLQVRTFFEFVRQMKATVWSALAPTGALPTGPAGRRDLLSAVKSTSTLWDRHTELFGSVGAQWERRRSGLITPKKERRRSGMIMPKKQ